MGIRLTVTGGGGDELRALNDWLGREDELRGRIQLVAEAPAEDEMGGGLDVLVAAVGSGGALAVLARSVGAWFSLQRGQHLRVTVVRPDGTRVEAEGDRVRDAAAFESILRTSLDGASEQS
jgi:hypothetical protein